MFTCQTEVFLCQIFNALSYYYNSQVFHFVASVSKSVRPQGKSTVSPAYM